VHFINDCPSDTMTSAVQSCDRMDNHRYTHRGGVTALCTVWEESGLLLGKGERKLDGMVGPELSTVIQTKSSKL